MISFDEYTKLDALALAEGVRRKDFTARELADAAFARIEAVNGKLAAIVYVARDFADAQLAAGLPDGPFTGVPFLVKDLSVPFKGLPQTNGSRFFKGFVPDADSPASARSAWPSSVSVSARLRWSFGSRSRRSSPAASNRLSSGESVPGSSCSRPDSSLTDSDPCCHSANITRY